MGDRYLFLVVCAASPARHIDALIVQLQASGWNVRVFATSEGSSWLNPTQIVQLTGHRLFVNVSDLSDAPVLRPSAVLIAPITFHTVNQVAAGANNSLALNVIHEAIGSGLPVVAAPHVNAALKANPLHHKGLETLCSLLRVHVVEDDACEGGCDSERHWRAVLAVLNIATTKNYDT